MHIYIYIYILLRIKAFVPPKKREKRIKAFKKIF